MQQGESPYAETALAIYATARCMNRGMYQPFPLLAWISAKQKAQSRAWLINNGFKPYVY